MHFLAAVRSGATTPIATHGFAARALTVATIAALVSACTGAASPTPGSTATAGTPTVPPVVEGSPTAGGSAEATGDAAAAPTPFPSKDGELQRVRLAQAVPQMAFAPLQVALHMNFFEYLGAEIEFVELQSGATALQALVGGSVDLVDSASTAALGSIVEGVDLLSIQATINQTLELCVSQAWAEEKGVTRESTLEERLAALEGATVGISGAGSGGDRTTRWLMSTYGGLDPNTQATVTAVGGGASGMAGALDAGQIDAFLLSPPSCQIANGVVLVPPTDVPEFENYVHEVLFGTREWIEANPEPARLVATAISMGNNYIIEYPEASLAILQEGPFAEVDAAIIEDAFYEVILPQVEAVPSGLQTEDGWSDTVSVLVESEVIPEPIPFEEGTFWTNEYIDVAAAEEILR